MADTNLSPATAQLRLTTRAPHMAIPGNTAARSGVARSGSTRSGDTTAVRSDFVESFDVEIGTELRTSYLDLDELSITLSMGDQPSRLVARARGFEPARGSEIRIYNGGLGGGIPIFGGTILTTRATFPKASGPAWFDIEAVDYRWLLNRFSRVTREYFNRGLNSILHNLIANFTDSSSGFTVGQVYGGQTTATASASAGASTVSVADTSKFSPTGGHAKSGSNHFSYQGISTGAGSGDLTTVRQVTQTINVGDTIINLPNIRRIEFAGETVTDAITTLVATIPGGAYWCIDPEKRICVFGEPDDEGNALTISDGDTFRDFVYTADLSQVATRVVYIGGGSETTAAVVPTGTTIPVAETGWFNPSGGSIRVGHETFTYTGISVGSGAGTITGVSGMTDGFVEGERVYNLVQADDTTAQTALADILGQSQSGVAVWEGSDHRLNYSTTEVRAKYHLQLRKSPVDSIEYEVDDDRNRSRPGRVVTLDLTSPITRAGDFRIQSVEITNRAGVSGSTLNLARRVRASAINQELASVLQPTM